MCAARTQRIARHGTLEIELLRHSHLADAPIAVQVSHSDQKSVWNGAIPIGGRQSLKLAPGDYVVEVVLPSGSTKMESATVSKGGSTLVTIDVVGSSPHETLAWVKLSRPELLDPSEGDETSLNSIWLRLWRNQGDGQWSLMPWPVQHATRYQGLVQYEFSFLNQPGQYYAQVGGADLPWRLVAVPADDVRLILKGRWVKDEEQRAQRHVEIEVATVNPHAEVLLAYLRSGRIDAAEEVSKSWQTQKLFEQKKTNPTLAAVAGYFLLSLQHLKQVHQIWAHNLADWIKWLPDGAVIDAWYLMRGGSKKGYAVARQRLIEATARGLPIYTRGMRLLRDGLDTFEDDPDYRTPSVSVALKTVRRYCAAAVWTSTTTTFIGTDPTMPGIVKFGRPETPQHVVFADPSNSDLEWLKAPDRNWTRTQYGYTAQQGIRSIPAPTELVALHSSSVPEAPIQMGAIISRAFAGSQTAAAPGQSASETVGNPLEAERVRRTAKGEESEAASPLQQSPATVAEVPEATAPGPEILRLVAMNQRAATRGGVDAPPRDTLERIQARLLRVADEQTESEQLAGTTSVPVDVGSGVPAHLSGVAVERVLGKSDLLSTSFLQRGVASTRAVARVGVLRDGQTITATGFLVSPRLLMTTAHFISNAEEAKAAFAEFDYQDGLDGLLLPVTRVAVDVDRFFFVDTELDVALVALHEEAGRQFSWLKLSENEGKTLVGEYLSTVGHPLGGPKQVALRELPILDMGELFFWCTSSTVQGSSGAPLFNDQWQIVGMQHASLSSANAAFRPRRRSNAPSSGEASNSTGGQLAIEAVRISRIVSRLKDKLPTKDRARESEKQTKPVSRFSEAEAGLIEEMLYARPFVESSVPLAISTPPNVVSSPFASVSPVTVTSVQANNQRVSTAGKANMSTLTPENISKWLRNLERFDPKLATSINARVAAMRPEVRSAVGLESTVAAAAPPPDVPIAIETMVRPGRPVLPIMGDRVTRSPAFIEPPDGEMMVQRLLAAAATINPVIPLVGRIDVANFPRNASFIGTGWLIEPDIVVTNSHVAELIGRRDGRQFTFLPGRFGNPIITSVNWKREMDSDDSVASPVESIIFIESRQIADIAFLKIGRRTDGARQDRIQLADTDAPAGTSVAVIGYPARAGEDVIQDQAWMERVFGGHYDVKRAAPGVVMPNSRGWATHDCTTLGGNSGSAVIDLATGKAVALHFAGAYVLENYAVPASTIREYLKRRPWNNPETINPEVDSSPKGISVTQSTTTPPAVQTASVSITLPLTITVSVGAPVTGTNVTAAVETASIEDAVNHFASAYRGDGILGVRSGLVIRNNEFTDTPCIHVVAHPERIATVRARVPASYLGHPVEVRAASVGEMIGGQDFLTEGNVTSIAYNDGDRTGPGFSFSRVDEDMEVLCCVGPERSWSVLSDYIAKAKGRMVSSMYEFHAEHIADAIEERLKGGVDMVLVMDNATRVNKGGVKSGDFNRKTVFRKWAQDFNFDRIYAPEGANGLIADSYHIKVTVDNDSRFWLSSGNWKNSSQPDIAPEDLDNLAKIRAKKGNREWHVVIKNKTLADCYRNHILADLEFSKEHDGAEEAVVEDVFVDVPIAIEEAVEFDLEARAAAQILEPIKINRRVSVKPLLTPDKKGKVYTDAVLDLIESAEDQLLFQIPYIDSYKPAAKGNLEKLVKAVVKKSKEIDDVRVILRSDHGTWIPCAEDLKKRGLNLNKCFRHLPSTHTKGMIADGLRCLVGSHNWSGGGVTLNRDASLLFDDKEVAEYYREAFEIDWARASRPVIPESAISEAPRLADPESPVPPGFRRMTLEEFLEG